MIPFPKVKVPMHKNERASPAPEAGSGRYYSLRMATNPVDGSSNISSAFLDSIVSNRSMAPLPEQAQVHTW
jgi:hypothetical protein